MTTQTLTLADFLLARIAEDESLARDAQRMEATPWRGEQVEYKVWRGDGPPYMQPEQCVVWNDTGQSIMRTNQAADACVGFHIARHDPARVLADVEAKRQIVTDWQTFQRGHDERAEGLPLPQVLTMAGIAKGYEMAVKTLTQSYADHADYRDEWRAV